MGKKKTKGLPDLSNVSLATGIYLSVVRCLVFDLILSCLILARLAFSYPLSLPF